MTPDASRRLAEAVRQACFEAAAAAAEDAGLSGLCADGRLEAALDAIRAMPLDRVLPPEADNPADPAGAPQASPDGTFSLKTAVNK